jgi:trans-aconitate 2-methyltransferase
MSIAKDKWNAKDYAKNSSAQESWANELVSKLALQGNEHLLDIGCGDGKITNSIAQKLNNGAVVGIDRSESMIELAKDQFDLPHLSFYTMDATEISTQERFDVAFSNAALHWVNDHNAVLVGLKKCLNRNAKILFQMGGYGNAQDVLEVVDQVTVSEEWKKYFDNFFFPYNFCNISDYEKWLPVAGYKARRIELITKDMVHENEEGLKGWLRTTWFPYTDQLPENKKEEFLSLVIEKYTNANPVDSEGKTHVNMVRLEVEASTL